EDGEHVTHTIPVTVVGKLSEPTKEWVLDQNVYISQSVLSEVEEFTGTRRGEPDPQYANEPSDDDDADTFDQVTVYAKNLEAVKGISDALDDHNYATYSVVNGMKEITTLFMVAKT